jgi:transposase
MSSSSESDAAFTLLSDRDKEIIHKGREKNVSYDIIAYMLGCRASTARSAYSRYKKIRGLPAKVFVKTPLISNEMGRTIKQLVKNLPYADIKTIYYTFLDTLPVNSQRPSLSTFRRYLSKSGFNRVKALKKQLIWPRNQAKRAEFAREFLQKPPEFWDRVIWSDETTVRTNPVSKELYVVVHNSSRREEMPINPQIQGGGISVMFWGCFSKLGLGSLVALEGNQNADSYIETLDTYLIDELLAAEEELGHKMTFMQDNAPCHKAKRVTEFLAHNNVSVLDWPPQSPDLNPIENLWAIVKRLRTKKFPKFPTTREELIDQVMETWDEITPELLNTLADSATSRLALCLKMDGKNTKY